MRRWMKRPAGRGGGVGASTIHGSHDPALPAPAAAPRSGVRHAQRRARSFRSGGDPSAGRGGAALRGGATAHLRWGERRGLLLLRGQPARLPGARRGRGLRSHLAHGAHGIDAIADPGLQWRGGDHLQLLPARRSRRGLRLHPPRWRRVSAEAGSLPGLRVGALRELRRLPLPRGRQRPAAPHRDAGLRRRGHRLREGRLDRLHLGARRRSRAVPHGRGRQERAAPHPHPGLRRRRLLQCGLQQARLAREPPQGPGPPGLPAAAGAGTGAALQARAVRGERGRERPGAGDLPGRGILRALLVPRRAAPPLLHQRG